MDLNIQHPEFYPRGSLENKKNMKRISRVFPGGSIVERVYLDVPDLRYREQIICLHYLRHITRHFLRDYIGVNIIGRDDPWDFKIELSNGDVFNVEITSIADNSMHFENNKKEERFNKWCVEEMIPLFELAKLVELFPDTNVANIVREHKNQNVSPNDLVQNPYFPPSTNLFISTLYETNDKLTDLLVEAIHKKVSKKHQEKEKTILIIDNRTGAYDVSDYYQALNDIYPLTNDWPFPEIWFYTGYYSDDSGNDAEFSFAPLKVTPKQSEVLARMKNSDSIDDNGTYVWS
jgi:hypothetical protein